MEFRQLQSFVTAVDQGSLTGAAAKCGISQPSLSLQIQALEEELGEPLLFRRSRGVEPTPAGQAVYRDACEILSRKKQLGRRFQKSGDPISGEIVVGVIPTVTPNRIPEIIRRFLDDFPQTKIAIREARTSALLKKVVDEEVDFAIVSDVAASDLKQRSLHLTELYAEPLVVAVPKSSRLGTPRKALQISDINREEHILLTEGNCLRDQVVSVCKNLQKHDRLECENLPSVLAMVAAGLGVAIVPAAAVTASPPPPGAIIRPFAPPQPMRKIFLLKRRGRPLSPAAGALAAAIRDANR